MICGKFKYQEIYHKPHKHEKQEKYHESHENLRNPRKNIKLRNLPQTTQT